MPTAAVPASAWYNAPDMGNPNFYKVFAGNSNPALAKAVVQNLGRELSAASVGAFSDGEIQVEIGENVRGVDTLRHPVDLPADVNDNLMELLIMIDALKRASAGSITAVIPYYGYARQDRKVAPRTPITAKLVADLIEAAGVDPRRLDGHARRADPGLLQHPLRPPLRHAGPARAHEQRFTDAGEPGHRLARRRRRRARARLLEAPRLRRWRIVDKRRTKPNVAEVMNVIGDVKGKVAILLDDMIDTAGTLTQAAAALKEKGATQVFAYATHAVLSGPAVERISRRAPSRRSS